MRWTNVLVMAAALAMSGAAATADDAGALDAVLGSAADWKLSSPQYVLEDGLASQPNTTLVVQSAAAHEAPCDLEVTCRLNPPDKSSTYMAVSMAVATRADNTAQALNFSASAPAGGTYLSYSLSTTGGTAPTRSGYQHVVAVTERSLAWSEPMRRAIEAQIAATPRVEERLINLRCTVEAGRFRAWLNGRYVGELALETAFETTGEIKITVPPNAKLVSARVTALKPTPARYEPLSIDGNLTGANLAGSRVDAASLAASNVVNDVPFAFARAGDAGNDHIDVGTSWARFGAIPGYIAASFGAFGGRWISADRLDPARLCMYVPQGRYKTLHLIAVAEDKPDTVPIVSAQFYRPDAGHPFNFSATVPTMEEANTASIPVKLADGRSVRLHHVTIPLDPDAFSWFTDLDRIGLEITKQVHYYRGYPDPLEYSWHGGGLPSSVQIYAMTLERAEVTADLTPERLGHVWTAPAMPKYTLTLRNETGAAPNAALSITTRSADGLDETTQTQQVSLPADGSPVSVPLTLKPTRYGLHELAVTCNDATYRRNFAYLHADTREQATWESGHGSVIGFWAWGGGHVTPPVEAEIEVMAAAGAETSTANYSTYKPEIQALAEKHRFISEGAFNAGVMYYNGFYSWYPNAPKFDPNDPEGSGKALIEAMIKLGKTPTSPISRPEYVPFFAEPQLGNITTGIWPAHYGEEYTFTESEQRTFEDMKAKYLAGASAIRKTWPELKLIMPYGDPMNTAMFLKFAPESRDLIDGCALDLPGFERLPEQQINQVVMNRLYPIMKDIKEYLPDPYLVLVEGFCVSSKDLDTGQQGQADIAMRNYLTLMGYGVTRFEGTNSAFDCANYWGENHYGGGWCTRLPLAMPKLAYVAYATLTRHLNRANYTQYIPTGSTSTFCQQYKHYKTGKLIHVLWTVRGKRPVSVKVAPGTKLELYDLHDNVTELTESGGVVTFTIDQSPCYLEGLTEDAQITLGEPDHSDAQVGAHSRRVAGLGDGSWTLVKKEDEEYAKNQPIQIERFLGNMSAKVVDAPAQQGGHALAVHLGEQEKDRGVMPYYTTLEPAQPVTIPGQASHLGLWVHASSDWGRVVYVLRDAADEKWISVGAPEDWNNDDIHGWSAFCFDGWRYVKFQMPGSAPYDSYRLHGTSWWGSYGGDGVVDLPLRVEKVIVERRNKAIYGADLVPVSTDDVLFGDLYAEYAQPGDADDDAVRLSRVRMPVSDDLPALSNPIAEMAETGIGAPGKVLNVTDPTYQYDGTRCHVHFELVEGAKSYDVWVSPYADGRGAIQLGKGWTESGGLIQGLRPDTTFYAFLTYTDAEGKVSKPSAPLELTLKSRFGYK